MNLEDENANEIFKTFLKVFAISVISIMVFIAFVKWIM